MWNATDAIALRLSDGLEALNPGEADAILIAGMGGGTILHILGDGWEKARSAKELILQPQSEIASVRAGIRELGFEIRDEDMVKEDGKYYPLMRIVPTEEPEGSRKSPEQLQMEDMFGPVLLAKKHPVLLEWIHREKHINERILEQLPSNEKARRMEVEEKVGLLDQAVFQMNKDRKQ